MDLCDQIFNYVDDNRTDIQKRLSETNDQIGEVGRLEAMLRNEFTVLPEGSKTHREMAELFIQEIVAEITAELRKRKGNAPITVNVNTIIDSPHSTINVSPPAKAKTKTRKLNFRRIDDPHLSLEDRIIYSYAWKRAYFNWKQNGTKPINLQYFRNATGFRPSTIKESIQRLKAGEYLSPKLEPNKHDARLNGYRKLAWQREDNEKHNLRRHIFEAMQRYNEIYFPDSSFGVAWYVKTLGISRITAWRWLHNRVTVETSKVTDETQLSNR